MSSSLISLFLVHAPCTLLPCTSVYSILGNSHRSHILSHSSLSSKFSYIFCRVSSGNDTTPGGAILISLYSFCFKYETCHLDISFLEFVTIQYDTIQDSTIISSHQAHKNTENQTGHIRAGVWGFQG